MEIVGISDYSHSVISVHLFLVRASVEIYTSNTVFVPNNSLMKNYNSFLVPTLESGSEKVVCCMASSHLLLQPNLFQS